MMTKPALKRLVAKWQERMRLQDWNITVEFVPLDTLNDKAAESTIHAHYRSASIQFERDPDADIDYLVRHELIHILLHRWIPPADPVREEADVDALASAMKPKRVSK